MSIKGSIDLGSAAPITRLVVPHSPGTQCDGAISLAAELATLWGLPVHLTFVQTGADEIADLDFHPDLHASKRSLLTGHPGVTVSIEVIRSRGPRAPALTATLTAGDLVVMSTDAGADIASESMAFELSRTWAHPILMVGPEAKVDVINGDAIVGLDGSAEAEYALSIAVRWAEALGVGLRVICVESDSPTAWSESTLTAEAYLEAIAERLPDIAFSAGVVTGADPARALADLAFDHHASILVLATHRGSTGPMSALTSKSLSTVRLADRPVLVV